MFIVNDRCDLALAVDGQEADAGSLLNFTRTMLALRKGNAPLRYGSMEVGDLMILGGAMGDTVLDMNGIKALAELPSLDELRATLIGLSLLGGAVSPELLTRGLGEDWAILQGYTKIYACCQHLHSAVEAALGDHPDRGLPDGLRTMAGERGAAPALSVGSVMLIGPRPLPMCRLAGRSAPSLL